jgi:hypothetical protein
MEQFLTPQSTHYETWPSPPPAAHQPDDLLHKSRVAGLRLNRRASPEPSGSAAGAFFHHPSGSSIGWMSHLQLMQRNKGRCAATELQTFRCTGSNVPWKRKFTDAVAVAAE